MISATISLGEFTRLQPFLEQLQEGFIVIGPNGILRTVSRQARSILGRRNAHGEAVLLLGADLFRQLCAPILTGESPGEPWREVQLQRVDQPVIDLAARSIPIEFENKTIGVIVVIQDISGEIGLHRRYKELLGRQRQINQHLRKEVAAKLREHEDDISQFSEILQLAPAIFASFLEEAITAIVTVEQLAAQPNLQEELLLKSFRAMHTLKGNARSLGLNLIGGRAHAVEDVLEKLRSTDAVGFRENVEALDEIVRDLKRSIDRARQLRERLGEQLTKQTETTNLETIEMMATLHTALLQAQKTIGGTHPAAAPIVNALRVIEKLGRVPLQPLFDYLRLMVANMARQERDVAPIVETVGGTFEIPSQAYKALAAALPHLIRNAVAHGIESAMDRLKQGKPPVGTICLEAIAKDKIIYLCVRDDGRGINLAKLTKEARRKGFEVPANGSTADIANLVFLPEVSTSDTVNLEKGRGMGASAAKEAIEAIGGRIRVVLPEHGGTEFQIALPI